MQPAPTATPTLTKEDFIAHVTAWAAERGEVIDTSPGSAIDYLCTLLAGDRAIMGRLCDDVDRARARDTDTT